MNATEATAWAKIRDGLNLAAEGINEMLDVACKTEFASAK